MNESSVKKAFRHAAFVSLGFAALFAVFFSPVLLSGRLLAPGDAINYSLPALLNPVLLWSNLVGCGIPLAADPQQQMWYPVALVCKAVGNFNLLVVAAYVIAACSMFAFVLNETSSKLAATISGITYSLCGFMSAHLGHTAMIHAAAWLPLLLLSISKLKSGFNAYWFLVGQISIACCFLGGHTQIFIMQLIAGGTFCLFTAIRHGKSWFKLLITYSFLFLLGIGLCALQLFPTTELAHESTRESLTYETFVSFSLPPRQLVQLFFPFICLAPLPCFTPSYAQSPYFGEWNPTELCGYVGILPFMLSLVALLDGKAGKSKWFFLCLAACGLLASFGGATPIGKLLYSIPVINYFRCPGRYVLLFDLAVSVLAGAGITALQKLPDTRTRLRLITTSSVITAVSMSLLFGRSLKFLTVHYKALSAGVLNLSPFANAYVALPMVLLFVAFIILVIWGWKPATKSSTSALVLLTILDLSSCAAFCDWRFADTRAELLQPPASIAQRLQAMKQPQFRMIAPFGTAGSPADCIPNIPSLWNVSAVTYYSPLETARSAALFEDQGSANALKACSSQDASLDLAAARFFVMPKPQTAHFREAVGARGVNNKHSGSANGNANTSPEAVADFSSRFSVVSEPGSPLVVFENKRVLPRFRFVEKVVALNSIDTLKAIKNSRFSNGDLFDPATTALVEEPVSGLEDAAVPTAAGTAMRAGGAKTAPSQITARADVEGISLQENNSSEIVINTIRVQSGMLVIADQYYKGWHCTVDGKETKIFRTDYTFKSVQVPAGKHLVKLEYRPQSFWVGLSLSILALLITVSLVIWERFSKRCIQSAVFQK
jgi:hypothetical protein